MLLYCENTQPAAVLSQIRVMKSCFHLLLAAVLCFKMASVGTPTAERQVKIPVSTTSGLVISSNKHISHWWWLRSWWKAGSVGQTEPYSFTVKLIMGVWKGGNSMCVRGGDKAVYTLRPALHENSLRSCLWWVHTNLCYFNLRNFHSFFSFSSFFAVRRDKPKNKKKTARIKMKWKTHKIHWSRLSKA